MKRVSHRGIEIYFAADNWRHFCYFEMMESGKSEWRRGVTSELNDSTNRLRVSVGAVFFFSFTACTDCGLNPAA